VDSIRKKNVLFGISGSVAAIKTKELTENLLKNNCNVIIVPTKMCTHFLPSLTDLQNLSSSCTGTLTILTDADEWALWKKLGDPVLHIALRNWADVFLIAPLSANTLGKLANGLSDNLLTCIARAWDFKKPFLVAPAMNTQMWLHPFTKKHLNVLTAELGIVVIPPIENYVLACGDVGAGAMALVSLIISNVMEKLK